MDDPTKTTARKRPPRYKAFFALGLVFLILGIGNNTAFIGVGAVFFIIGAAGLAKERKARQDQDEQSGSG